MSLNLGFKPTALDHVKNEETDWCYSVNWTEDNQVLCVPLKGLTLRDTDLEIISEIEKDETYDFLSAMLCGSKLLTRVKVNAEYCAAYLGSLKEPTRVVLHNENSVYAGPLIHSSISKHLIVHMEASVNNLKVFSSTNEKHLFDIELELDSPSASLITGDALLVADRWSNNLCKYDLSPSPDPTWTYNELNWPTSVAVDESGLIYLASKLEPAVHIICPDKGKVIHNNILC